MVVCKKIIIFAPLLQIMIITTKNQSMISKLSHRLTTVVILLTISVVDCILVHSQQLRFKHLTLEQGLSNSKVNCIHKDSKGYMWFGTVSGLNRYDGFRIRIFDTQNTPTMQYDIINDIQEIDDYRFVIRQGERYCLFDPVREIFDLNISRWTEQLGIKGNPEYIYSDRKGLIWIKVWEGEIFSYNQKNGKTVEYHIRDPKHNLPPNALVTGMTEQGNNIAIIFNTGDIVTIDSKNERISHVSHYIREHGGNKLRYTLWISPQGDYWVNAQGDMYVYKHSEGKWYKSLPNFLLSQGYGNVPHSLMVWDVVFEGNSDIWLATDHYGIVHIDKKQKTIKSFVYDKDNANSPSDNTMICLALTNDNILWSGSLKGGVNACHRSNNAIRGFRIGNVNTIVQDHNDMVWLGTNDKGLIRLNPNTMQSDVFNKRNSGLKSDVIVSSLAAKDGTLWFGTFNGGLSHYVNGKFQTWMPDGNENNVSNINIWALAEDSTGNVWLGTLGTGIQRIDGKTGAFTSFPANKKGISSNYISSMQTDSRGWIYVGTSDNYSMVNPNTQEIVNKKLQGRMGALPSIQVIKDSRGLVWYASTSGLAVYDSSNDNYVDMGENGVLKMSMICSVIEDNDHNMWIATEDRIIRIRPYNKEGKWMFTFNSFGKHDGLISQQFNQRSACLLNDGRIWIGGIDGVDVITPSKLLKSTVGKPIFSGLLINGENITVAKDYNGRVILERPLHEGNLTLNESDRQFTITIGTDNYSTNQQCQFEYQLKGFNDRWLPIDANNPQIYFTSLPSGHYTLNVRCVGADNEDATMIHLQITIAPPFYLSWWAYTIYALLVVALLYLWASRERKRQRLERLKLQKDNKRHEEELKMELYTGLTDEIKNPYRETSEKLFDLMKNEKDEARYRKLQDIMEGFEHVFVKFNAYIDNLAKKEFLVPKITENEITSLDQQLVEQATEYVEKNIDNGDLSVETMGKALGMSRVHLYKRLLDITGLTPSEFIRDIRVRHAERLLRYSQMNIREISFKVGFNNPRYLAKHFKEKYGVLPSQYLSDHIEETNRKIEDITEND